MTGVEISFKLICPVYETIIYISMGEHSFWKNVIESDNKRQKEDQEQNDFHVESYVLWIRNKRCHRTNKPNDYRGFHILALYVFELILYIFLLYANTVFFYFQDFFILIVFYWLHDWEKEN